MARPAATASPDPAASTRPPSGVAADLLAWYDRSRRVLPWRALPGSQPDAYAVWLSEIMLQQTTVQAVRPYYAKFLDRWPTVGALATATPEAVMQAWAGLGYYSRARNLHACAIAVAREHGGRFPDTEAGLRALPGIGVYTAAAIAAIAFGRDAVVVDGNVERVMARLHAIETPLPRAKPELTRCMAAVTPTGRAGDFAQATMDLGATICTPRNPSCIICPVRRHCAAVTLGLQSVLPRRTAKPPDRLRHGLAYFMTSETGAVLVRTRPPQGLLGGTVEIPGSLWETVEAPPALPAAGDAMGRFAGRVTHVFTHFTLLLDVIVSPKSAPETQGVIALDNTRWVSVQDLDNEALSTLMRNVVSCALSAGTDPSRPDRRPGSRKRPRN